MPRLIARLARIAGSVPLTSYLRAGEFAFGALRHVPRDHAAVGGEMRDRRAVLVADPEGAVGEPHDAFGVEAVELARQRLAGAVHGVLGRRGLERIEHAGERHAVAVLERDDVGDAEGAVVEQHHAIDRRRVGRRRIDAAVLHALAGREVDAGDLLHLAAGDVGTAVADRPDHVRRVLRAAPGAGADADGEVERLAAFEGERADAQQRVVAQVVTRPGCRPPPPGPATNVARMSAARPPARRVDIDTSSH